MTRYLIKTGRWYTVVHVDLDANTCKVPTDDGWYSFSGTCDLTVQRCAVEPTGYAYGRLRDALADYPDAVRREELDA